MAFPWPFKIWLTSVTFPGMDIALTLIFPGFSGLWESCWFNAWLHFDIHLQFVMQRKYSCIHGHYSVCYHKRWSSTLIQLNSLKGFLLSRFINCSHIYIKFDVSKCHTILHTKATYQKHLRHALNAFASISVYFSTFLA